MQTETIPNSHTADLKAGLLQMAQSINPTFFTTVRFNNHSPLTFNQAERALSLFSAGIDRILLGRSYANIPDDHRTRFLAIPEGRPSTRPDALDGFHFHILMSPPPKPKRAIDEQYFAGLVATAWKKFVPSGDIDVRPTFNLAGVASYMEKHISNANSVGLQHFVLGPMSRPGKTPSPTNRVPDCPDRRTVLEPSRSKNDWHVRAGHTSAGSGKVVSGQSPAAGADTITALSKEITSNSRTSPLRSAEQRPSTFYLAAAVPVAGITGRAA